MPTIINLNCGEAEQANVRSDIDLSDKKKPWEKGFESVEHDQKAEYRQSLGDQRGAIINRDVEKK